MVFSSLSFLIIFLPVLIILFFLSPAKWKNCRQYVLLIFSLVFYGAGEPRYIFMIIACIVITWLLSDSVRKRNKVSLFVSILVNIIPLIITKYAGFIIRNINHFSGSWQLSVPQITMPIGISFYTFQVITYIVDLYRQKIDQQKNPLLFALYIMFFPQLIAGPIVQYSEIAKEIEQPDISWDNIKYGTGRFIIGLGKKVLIANQAGFIASTIQECTLRSLSTGMAWLCVFSYTIQIYFDFSGYSEMAIGLGSIFGFHFPENFKDPYTSRSVTEFWRKWHITLGRFFREYVYIPLGGNRVCLPRWILNISIVWMLTGLWHGASWNFVIWGVYYGFLIIIERMTKVSSKLPKLAGWFITFFLVMLGWSIFMNDQHSLRNMVSYIKKLFFLNNNVVNPVSIGSLKLWGYIPFLLIGFFISIPVGVTLRNRIAAIQNTNSTVVNLISDVTLLIIFAASILFLVGGTYNPFIYFRF